MARPAVRLPALLSEAAVYGLAILAALLTSGLFVALLGGNVAVAFATIATSAFGSIAGVAQTLNKATPLMLGGVAVVLGMRGGYVNIGVDGQIYAGAIAATGLALAVGDLRWSPVLLVPLVMLAGLAGGALMGLIPAALRARFGVSEIFVTVMLNFIALFLTEYLATGPWNDPMAGEAITRLIPGEARLPMLLTRAGAHSGILVALAAGAAIAWMLGRTVLGYHIRAVGDNPRAARIGGISIAAVTMVTLPLSGALGGLAGAIEVAGFHHRLILGLTPGYGAMAILIAAISRRHPVGAMVAALLFAGLLVGSDSLQRSIGLPASAVFVFQAVVLLVLLAAEGWRATMERRAVPKAASPAAEPAS